MNILCPTIEQYLLSPCLLTIDEFNEKYSSFSMAQLKQIADDKYNEMDICVRIGYPFKQMVHYTKGDLKKEQNVKINHDLYIELRDFKIELKYLKNWNCSSGTKSASLNWDTIQNDFDWLQYEIRNGNKGKRAFIIGWFNCVERFSQLIKLGEGAGSKPLINETRVSYFPFLTKDKVPTYTSDLVYNYADAYKPVSVNLIGKDNQHISCLLVGNETDVFHFAIYF